MPRSRSRAIALQVFAFAGLAFGSVSANAATSDDAESSVAPPLTFGREPVQLKEVNVIGTRIPTAAAESMFDLHL